MTTHTRLVPVGGALGRGGLRVETLVLTALFVCLRLLTADVSNPYIAPCLPFVGVVLIALLLYTNRSWGFIFVIYDMCLLGEQVGVTAWQFYDLLRFRDLEFLVLMAVGIQMGGLSYRGKAFRRLTRPLLFYVVLMGLAIVYSAAVNGLSAALQPSRTLLYIALIFVMPAYYRTQDSLRRLLTYLMFFVTLSTVVDFAGFVISNPAAMTPFNHNTDLAGKAWEGLGGVDRVYAGVGYAGYAVPFNFMAILCLAALMVAGRRARLWWLVVLALAIGLELLSISKSSLGGLAIGLAVIAGLGLRRGGVKVALAVGTLCLAGLAVVGVAALSDDGQGIVTKYGERIQQAVGQLRSGEEGSVSARLDYFRTAGEVRKVSNGTALFGMGYQLLPTDYGVVYQIAPFNAPAFQDSGQLIGTTSLDSGWANVFWSLGYVGVAFFLWLNMFYLRASYGIFRKAGDQVTAGLALGLFAFFCVFPLLFFGMTLIYGKQQTYFIFQVLLLIGFLGLWLDYGRQKAVA